MGFQSNQSTLRSNNNSNQQNNEQWKAQGFLNLYLPTKDGGRRKLGAIPLKEAVSTEKAMLDWLKEDPTRVEAILNKLEIEFRTAEPKEGSAFDLG
jgi:hypothetical protein